MELESRLRNGLHQDDRPAPFPLNLQLRLQHGDPVVRKTDRGSNGRGKLVGLPFPAGDFGDLLESMMLRQSLLCDLVVSFYVFSRLHSVI